MYERFQFRSADMRRVYLQDESVFLINYLETQSAETASVAYLQQVARVRLNLDMAASLIVEKLKPSGVFFFICIYWSLLRSWAGVGELIYRRFHFILIRRTKRESEWNQGISGQC